MSKKQTPLAIDGINESIYAEFGARLGSILLDTLIMIPAIFITLFLNSLSKNAYYFTFIPYLFFHFWYSIYLVKRYGGTPGKLITGIKILKIDGADVSWKEAILRDLPKLLLSIFFAIITLIALSQTDAEYYESLSWMQKQKYLMTLTPILFIIYKWASHIWTYSELFVLLFNTRKRALHDFIAETVVVKTKYINRIRQDMNE